jgi:hypothetical protein
MTRNQSLIPPIRKFGETLVQQQIAIVEAVGEVIDDHDLFRIRAYLPFPSSVKAVVVHDQPVDLWSPGDTADGVPGIALPRDPRPRMDREFRKSVMEGCVSGGETMDREIHFLNP